MKALLKKEFKFINPACYLAYFFVFMVFIPNYPMAVVFFFPLTLSINLYISSIAENNDLLFSSLLPIRKKDFVKAKLFIVCFFEISFLILSLPLLFTRKFIFPASYLENTPGLDSILSILGYSLLSYGLYNIIYFSIYFKTTPKRVLAYLVSLFTAMFSFALFGIGFAYLPTIGKLLDYNGSLLYQSLFFLIGLLLFLLFNVLTYEISKKELENKDL